MKTLPSGKLPRAILVFLLVLVLAPLVRSADGLTLAWTNNLLIISGPNVPGGRIEVWYLEAFCRSGSTHRARGERGPLFQ